MGGGRARNSCSGRLLDHAATREAVMTQEVAAALRGKALVQLSTTRANEAGELARRAEAPGVGRYTLKPREAHTWPALRRHGGLRGCEGSAFFLEQ